MNLICFYRFLCLVVCVIFVVSCCIYVSEGGVDNIGLGIDGFFILLLDVDNFFDYMFVFNVYYNYYEVRKLNISFFGGKVFDVKISLDVIIFCLDYLSLLWIFGGCLGGYIVQFYFC